MEAFPFDERDSDAVFGAPGAVVPDSLRDVADLVQAARRPGSADELVGGDELVAGIAAAIGEHAAPLPSVADERIRVLTKFRTAKLAAAATAVLMLGGTAAAAATGALPTPLPRHHAELASAEMSTGPSGATGATGATGHHGRHNGVSGTVASVNGSTDPAACGSGDTGTFTVTGRDGKTFTVNVSPTTTFGNGHGHDDGDDDDQASAPAQSFADVCVGTKVGAKGDVTDTTVAADRVLMRGDHDGDD